MSKRKEVDDPYYTKARRVAAIIIFSLVIIGALIFFEEKPPKNLLKQSLATAQQRMFFSSLTGIQQEELWKKEYEGKTIVWEGYVKSIDKNLFGTYVALVRVEPVGQYSIGSDVAVFFKKDQVQKLLSYSENNIISFEGELTMYRPVLESFVVDDAIITDSVSEEK